MIYKYGEFSDNQIKQTKEYIRQYQIININMSYKYDADSKSFVLVDEQVVVFEN